jgi:hypothetical protein
MNTSFEEKSAWITLGSLVVLFGGYFVLAGRMLAAGVTEPAAYAPLFAITVILLVAVMVTAHTVAAIVARPDGRDERDRLINWRAEAKSAWILGAGVLGAILVLVTPLERVLVAHLLLVALFLSEVVKLALQVIYYRRGM